jgi:hypothetical protein
MHHQPSPLCELRDQCPDQARAERRTHPRHVLRTVHQEGQFLGKQQLGICTELNSSTEALNAGHRLARHDGSFLAGRLAVKRRGDRTSNARNTKRSFGSAVASGSEARNAGTELSSFDRRSTPCAHLFQVISRRYEHGSIILTTNRGIASWGEIFDDSTVAAAILDRLLHHATVLQNDGDSYRMRGHRARLATLRAGLNHPTEGGEFSRSHLGNSRDR